MAETQKRILLVDDDESIAELLRFALPEYELNAVRDAESARDVAAVFQPDLFVLDLVLPGMRGTSLALLLRDDPRFQKTPIFLISGLIEGEPQGEPVRIHGLPAFRKPFALEVFKKHVKLHLLGPESAEASLANLEPGHISGEP
jgi:DNA-binding response OmpR family regulator